MGSAHSVEYNVADEEGGETDEIISIAFKDLDGNYEACILTVFNQLSEQRMHSILNDQEKYPKIFEAVKYLRNFYGTFCYHKDDVQSYVKDTLREETHENKEEGDYTRLVRAWVKDMRDGELNLVLKESFTEEDWA